ncbi:hypothetical protein BASA81_008388 [Batrachochytrium salamandrivorans]|nr:hypothetical protein BASA81_008388 [Batrachochytrium salamandrivorans]
MPVTRVVFQGVDGAYSDAAARQLLNAQRLSAAPNNLEKVQIKGLPTFEACFQAVTDGEADFACLPMENTMGGSIQDNYDLQLKNQLHSTAEIHFKVVHCLMALPGQALKDIHTVISHPQALAQCAEFCRRELPWATVRPEADTAGSAMLISSEKRSGVAAIASKTASEFYHLELLKEGCQDALDNVTRFQLFARTPVNASNVLKQGAVKLKCSLMFTIGNRAGALHLAIQPFARHHLDLTKVESRPDRRRVEAREMVVRDGGALKHVFGGNFLDNLPAPVEDEHDTGELEYRAMFFLDFVMGSEEHTLEAIKELAAMSPFLRVLGVYAAEGVLLDHVAQRLGCVEGTNFSSGKPPAAMALTRKRSRMNEEEVKLKIGLVGFGNFGQFLAKKMRSLGHPVLAWSRASASYAAVAEELDVTLVDNLLQLLREPGLDVVLISTSILSFEHIIQQLPANLLQGKLVVDVLSVKTLPKRLFLEHYESTPGIDLLCTHPMFGPESGKFSWKALPFVYEKVRCGNEERTERFLNLFAQSGCRMMELSCEEHDRRAANSQFVTHFTGRVLKELQLRPTGIDTTGFLSLLNLVENTCKDSDDLFVALFKENPNAMATLDAFKLAVDAVALRLKQCTSNTGTLQLSDVVGRIAPSKTVKIHSMAMDLVAQGRDVVTTLTVGEPNFGPPEAALVAGEQALRSDKGTKYTAVSGTAELRKAICKDYLERKGVHYDFAKQVLVSGGGKQSIYQAIFAICGPGDEVIVPAPYWVSYPDICRLAGAKPVFVQREAKRGYIMTPQQLEQAITPRTRCVILCNPCNPTGSLYSRQDLVALKQVLERYPKVICLSDEIYERIIFPGEPEHVSFASLLPNQTLVVNGVAKGFAMTGMRIGWLLGPEQIVKAAEKLQSQISSSACSVSQAMACAALALHPSVAGPGPANLAALERNRDLGYELLKRIPGVETVKGGGAFYFFVSVLPEYQPKGLTCEKLCEHLIKRPEGVSMVPGDAFGETAESCSFRISYACSESDLRKGIQRFQQGLEELQNLQ